MLLKASRRHSLEERIMAHPVSFFFALILCSLTLAANSEVYHIRTITATADLCTTPCLTISEFFTNLSCYLHSNTTALAFLPGTHYLTVIVSASNMNYFSMTSENITAQIVCRNYSYISFNHSQHVSILNLEFIGCGSNQVKRCGEIYS